MNEKAYNTYSLQQVAEFLKISVRGVYRRIESRELVCIKVGGLNRVREVDLDAYMERQASKNGVRT
jgi:excisionase family DNA binding protein